MFDSGVVLWSWRVAPALALAAAAGAASMRSQAPRVSEDIGSGPRRSQITFTKDIARILQQKCQECHRPGSIAPMSLLTYEEVKAFAPLIKTRVQDRIMPPWHIDKTVGIRAFKNDRSLTDAQIDTIVQWVDAGAPLGDLRYVPQPALWPDPKVWRLAEMLGEPDLIVRSAPYNVPAYGADKWWRPVVETGVAEQRWVRALEMRPSFPHGYRTVHHTLAYLEQKEARGPLGIPDAGHHMSGGIFMEWAVGKVGEVFGQNSGKLMLPGSRIGWEVHYHPAGVEIKDDVVELGIWFYRKGTRPKYRTIAHRFNIVPAGDLDIPPGRKTIVQYSYILQAPARLESFQPHMHMRGVAMSMEAVFPDGRRETLSKVTNFQWRWQINYIYADSAAPLLPKGTVLFFTAWHDNTAANPNNPDSEQWVGWGERAVDEMAHAWVGVTYLEEDDFKRLVRQRLGERADTTYLSEWLTQRRLFISFLFVVGIFVAVRKRLLSEASRTLER